MSANGLGMIVDASQIACHNQDRRFNSKIHGILMVSLLHLSDIHCGKGQLVDEDLKDHVPNAERSKQLARLREYIIELPKKPDFVIVSGDITIRGQEDGFEEFRHWLLDLIASGHLPPREHFLIVPGNHDVTRQTRQPLSRKKQFELFWRHFGTTFPHSHIPELDPHPVDSPVVDERMAAVQGGLSAKEINGKVDLVGSLPFLLSLEHDLLIYGFNSAHGCGVPGKPDAKIINNLQSLINLAGPDGKEKQALLDIEKSYLDSLVIDAGMITDDQIRCFHRQLSSLKKALGHRFERLTKIAVLHHHVGNLWSQPLELKKFEAVVDAAQLKQSLIEQSFDIVLHGHKHLNHVGLDGALIPIQSKDRYNPLCIVSGGTIAGFPRHGDRPTFKVLEFSEPLGPRRAGIVRETPIRGYGNISEAIRSESITFNIPVNNRRPELHDFQSAKVKLDDALVARCSPELHHPSGSTAWNVELANSGDGLVSETLRYRCYAQHATQTSLTFYEVLQVTKKLKFRDYSRLRWFITAAEHNFDPAKNNKIAINIGIFDDTHFSEADDPDEIRNSISMLESYFQKAINDGTVDIRVHNFSQEELIEITRATLV